MQDLKHSGKPFNSDLWFQCSQGYQKLRDGELHHLCFVSRTL